VSEGPDLSMEWAAGISGWARASFDEPDTWANRMGEGGVCWT